MEATIWALLPPVLAIIISLITKEVNLSLLVGIIVGAGIYCGFNPFVTTTTIFDVMSTRVYSNIGVLFFIILLGMIVHLMNLSGATHEYAKWAGRKLRTKRSSLLATMILGIVIFVDDYFNCLTVGTVMRPITDKNRVSREKLAYIIDSTAAPICIIAPISSWAAAVSSSLPENCGIDGYQLFIKTIFSNYYSLLSLVMVFCVIVFSVNLGKMKKCEGVANRIGNIVTEDSSVLASVSSRGKVIDLVAPVVGIIFFSIISMLYTGEYFTKNISIGEAFANCDAITGLAMGAAFTVVLVAVLYLPRKIVTGKEFVDGLIEGFIHMVPATLILTFAWTLSGICGESYLNAGGYVSSIVSEYNVNLILMPAIFFIVALLLAFSTGTSWGTFAILLPIIVSVFGGNESELMVMTTAAVLGGSVCGDHISPISDTTILSSTGAGCPHINHVATQLQYGLVVAGVTTISYIIGAITMSALAGLIFGIVIIFVLCGCVVMIERNKSDEKI